MIGFLATLAGLLYCFVWLRPPEIAGVVLPAQRVLGWTALAVFLGRLLVKGPLVVGPAARGFLRWVLVFTGFLVLTLVQQLAFGEHFHLLYFAMDFSKYAAAFAMAYLCYYALTTRLISEGRLIGSIVASGHLATFLVFGLMAIYFAGLRTDNEIIARSFGGALGVWPTSGALPRLAGPTAEPQQLSVALLTPLLLTLSPQYVRRYWWIGGLTVLILLLSQSKFALISLMVVGLYLLLVYRRVRLPLMLGALAIAPAFAMILLRLPTLRTTLEEGLAAGAFAERLGNLMLLFSIIREHPWFGIGAGHYGVYRGLLFFGDWRYEPGYTPNMDFLKVFAETGVVGFLLILFLMGFLIRIFLRGYRSLAYEVRPTFLALFLGALTIILNMTIGYELLHAFFWINIGMLLYLVDQARWSQETGAQRTTDSFIQPVQPVLQT